MSVSDSIADMLCIIKNGLKTKRETVEIPYSRIKFGIVSILKKEGFINDASKVLVNDKPVINLKLKYDSKGNPTITDIIRISTPGKRKYLAKADIPKIKQGFGTSILSTNKGLLTGRDARINNLGGEEICHVW